MRRLPPEDSPNTPGENGTVANVPRPPTSETFTSSLSGTHRRRDSGCGGGEPFGTFSEILTLFAVWLSGLSEFEEEVKNDCLVVRLALRLENDINDGDKCALDAFSVASKTSSRCDVDVIVQICQRLPIQTYPNMYSPPSPLSCPQSVRSSVPNGTATE